MLNESIKTEKFQRFKDFYPYYLSEHSDPKCRQMHYIGTSLTLGIVVIALLTLNPFWLLLGPVAGYSFAWIGHFFIEKNRPATFTYPLWSLMGDYVMYFSWLSGKLPNQLKQAQAKFGQP